MKKFLLLMGASVALVLTSACGSPASGPAGEPAAPASSSGPASGDTISSEEDPSADAMSPACTPVAGGIPATAKDFACLNLISVSGSDATGALPWLGTDPFTLVTSEQDGGIHFSSKTPCNTVMSSATVTDTTFTVAPNMAMTMMGCQSPQNDYEGWVVKFFSAPLDYTVAKDSLELSNSHGTVTFKPAAP
ncbi:MULTISPECIES: META domain-containing protein [Arthrobacter]|uniref:DUF306 domain-containing protein n=1 Tax=Arthrobacter psychrochitiniphilus TaxID=291045 RepID=A0A2V3E0Q5_9MICC|nr:MULTISPECIES: META domain-containing protein [Arthrobacter]NYG15674.1 hypothetical protein [Arthrobacter psychrochitiniphilus]PXA66853.1 hypothetical protein CVS29_04630 [Arthrobacter psychrochitiniphilus]